MIVFHDFSTKLLKFSKFYDIIKALIKKNNLNYMTFDKLILITLLSVYSKLVAID